MKKYIYSIFIALTFVSCSEIIEVPDISDGTVSLIAPVDNATVDIATLTLSWEVVEDAESYQVQIARPDFENILQLVKDSTLTQNSISVNLEASTSYQWRVRAKNSDYATPYTTYSLTLNTIEVSDISNEIVNLVAPSDNATLDITTLTLSWEAVENAENYQVQVVRPNFEDILQLEKDSILTGNSMSIDLEAGNSYEWRVRAKNSQYETQYTTYSFSLE